LANTRGKRDTLQQGGRKGVVTVATETRRADTADEAEVYQHLERRPGSWRRQLHIKGLHLSVAHIVYGMRANDMTAEEAAEDYDLPVEAIREALLYYERHRDLVEADQDEERRLIEAHGIPIDPPAVPRR
jgi:uncharacterized protein (DUF433 family)